MDRMIHTALTGMEAAMNRQRVTASNLANANTPGFRAETFTLQPAVLKDGAQAEARALPRGGVHGADMRGGSVSPTGNPLDIALGGTSLLAIQAPDGGEAYTRRGDLKIGPGGVLETGDGRPVLGDAGPVTVPGGRTIAIAADGTITASDPAAPDAAPERIARLKLASIEGSAIAKGLDGHLRVPGGGVLPRDEAATLTSGALEGSNVDTGAVLADMIEAQRAYERRAKLLTTTQRIDEAGARLLAQPR